MGNYLKLSSEQFEIAQGNSTSSKLKANLRRSSAEAFDTIYTRYKVKLDAKKDLNPFTMIKAKSTA